MHSTVHATPSNLTCGRCARMHTSVLAVLLIVFGLWGVVPTMRDPVSGHGAWRWFLVLPVAERAGGCQEWLAGMHGMY